jgi:hypothetical protein
MKGSLVMETTIGQNENYHNRSIDEILRGEMSASDSYEQVASNLSSDVEKSRLNEFKQEHLAAIDFWKTQATVDGAVPETDSGVWGKAVEAFVGTSKLLGNTSALRALREGEEHGLKNYQELLERDDLTTVQKNQIKRQFIPTQEKHINSLNAMIKMH